MAAEPIRRPFTVKEYYKLGKAGIFQPDERVELIDGEIIEMPPIGDRHASCVGRITRFFAQTLLASVHIWVQNPVRLSPRSEPVPDVMLLRPRADFYAGGHPTADDVFLLIEVSDTTLGYDRGTKVPLYARHGVPEVWIADLGQGAVHVYRDPTPRGYRVTEIRQRGQSLTIAAFPDITVSVEDILGP